MPLSSLATNEEIQTIATAILEIRMILNNRFPSDARSQELAGVVLKTLLWGTEHVPSDGSAQL